jgi:demethylmenaquinone methyltransferase/2-methoxy-6-polyprenyl-1,4-benzoquinol methylase
MDDATEKDPVREQIAYYDARAPEYDDWWARRNRYDAGEAFAAAWSADVSELTRWLAQLGPRGHTLEIAAGTGNWTCELLKHVKHVTALDASRAMLEINARKTGSSRVDYVVADVLEWSPPRQYDTVFFSFWISLVPPDCWERFWRVVRRSLAPGGTVLFIDSAHPSHATQNGPVNSFDANRPQTSTQFLGRRRLSDGSEFSVVKRYWAPEQLRQELAALGWHASIATTRFAFLYGTAVRAQNERSTAG